MKAQALRTIILSLPDQVTMDAALTILRSGKGGLTAVQSGTVAYPINGDGTGPLANSVELGPPPIAYFDGINYVMYLFVVSA